MTTDQPMLAHIPERGWTPEKKARFLDRLAAHGNVRAACRAVRLSAEAAYRLRRRDALFARGWAAALVLARQNGEQVLGERAIEGVEEDIYYRGEMVGTRRRFDGRLLLAHLARLDRLADEDAAGKDAGQFDELLLAIAEESEVESPQGREAFAEAAARQAGKDHERKRLAAYWARDRIDTGVSGKIADRVEKDTACDGTGDDGAGDYRAFFAVLDDECEDVAEEARWTAGEQWDRARAERLEAIDRLCDPAVPTPGLASVLAQQHVAEGIAALRRGAATGPGTLPWTVSTVSTGALARAMSGGAPVPGRPPNSPFQLKRAGAG